MVDPLDARQQLEAEQPGDAEADLGLTVAVGVVRLDLHRGAVPHCPFDHRGDLGGGAGDQLRVDRHGLAFDVPVDEHAAAAVARVPLGEDVLVVGAEVRRVAGHGGRAGAPRLLRADGEGGVGDLHCHRPCGLGGQEAAAYVTQVVLAVAVIACRGGLDAGVGAVAVHAQQQPLGQDRGIHAGADADAGGRAQAAGAQRRLLEHVDQSDGAPLPLDLTLEPAQVPRLRQRVQGLELDAGAAPAGSSRSTRAAGRGRRAGRPARCASGCGVRR